jgi:hypothetical protein
MIGSGDRAYRIAAGSNGLAIEGPGVTTVSTEMIFGHGLTVSAEPFSTAKGALRAQHAKHGQVPVAELQWGDAWITCTMLEFPHRGQRCTLLAAEDGLRIELGKSLLKCNYFSLDLEQGLISTERPNPIPAK